MKGDPDLHKVEDIHVRRSGDIVTMIEEMKRSGGFMAKRLAEAARIVVTMNRDRKCTKFLSFPAAPVATGMRGVLVDMVKGGMVDAIVTASGTLDHDVARTYSNYYHGDFNMDDKELFRRGIHRLGNVLVPLENYGPLIEKKVQPLLSRRYSEGARSLSSRELCSDLGLMLDSESSLLYWAHKRKVPVFVPGLMDGAVGSQIWLFSQKHRDFKVDPMADEEMLSEIVYGSRKIGALIIGGGITKHHVLWWSMFRKGLDYVCYITTAMEYDGSLSGAQVREAVSWGKVKATAKNATLYADATAVLPFIISYAMTKLSAEQE